MWTLNASEATLTLVYPRDWTAEGVGQLVRKEYALEAAGSDGGGRRGGVRLARVKTLAEAGVPVTLLAAEGGRTIVTDVQDLVRESAPLAAAGAAVLQIVENGFGEGAVAGAELRYGEPLIGLEGPGAAHPLPHVEDLLGNHLAEIGSEDDGKRLVVVHEADPATGVVAERGMEQNQILVLEE